MNYYNILDCTNVSLLKELSGTETQRIHNMNLPRT